MLARGAAAGEDFGGGEGGNRILIRNPENHEPDFIVEVLRAMNYSCAMPQTIEKRVEELEKQVAELSAQILGLQPRQKDWRRVAGSMADDELSREAERLGREYRQQQTYEKELAGS
jgi:hypothetical protein